MENLAWINGLIRTALAVLSGAFMGAGIDVSDETAMLGGNVDLIVGAVGALITAGWSYYNKVAHKEEVVVAARTGIAEVKA